MENITMSQKVFLEATIDALQSIHEAEDSNVTKAVVKHTDDPDALHVGTVGHEHVYAGESPDRETHVYYVHNSKTGKTHEAALEHAGEALSHDEVHKEFGGNISKAASKMVHKDHKDEVGGEIHEAVDHDHKSYSLSHDSFKSGTKSSSGESGNIAKRGNLHAKETEAGDSSTDANIVYGVHDSKTGKTHGVSISMNKKASAEKVAKAMGHKQHQIHKDIADHHNETSYVGS